MFIKKSKEEMLINIVIDAINEIKDCWHLAKQATNKVHNGTFLSLMYLNVSKCSVSPRILNPDFILHQDPWRVFHVRSY